jgi:hypothetical protein
MHRGVDGSALTAELEAPAGRVMPSSIRGQLPRAHVDCVGCMIKKTGPRRQHGPLMRRKDSFRRALGLPGVDGGALMHSFQTPAGRVMPSSRPRRVMARQLPLQTAAVFPRRLRFAASNMLLAFWAA